MGVCSFSYSQTGTGALFQQGMEAYQRGEYGKAETYLTGFLDRAPDGSPNIAAAEGALGLSLYLESNHGKAIPWLARASASAPGNAEVTYALAMCHLRLADRQEARHALSQLFNIPPESGGAYVLTAGFLIDLNYWDQARRELETPAERSPNHPRLHYLLGLLALHDGNWDKAADELQQEVKLNPSDAMAHYQLGRAHSGQQQSPLAISALQKSIWLNPYFTGPYILLGQLYHRDGRQELARGLLKQALGMDPNNVTAHYWLGNVYRDLGQKREASEHYEAARELKLEQDGPRDPQ